MHETRWLIKEARNCICWNYVAKPENKRNDEYNVLCGLIQRDISEWTPPTSLTINTHNQRWSFDDTYTTEVHDYLLDFFHVECQRNQLKSRGKEYHIYTEGSGMAWPFQLSLNWLFPLTHYKRKRMFSLIFKWQQRTNALMSDEFTKLQTEINGLLLYCS